MILSDKTAVIYGAGGSLGGAIAKAFALAGAKVFLTGRNIDSVQITADAILAAGGKAKVDRVDALDEMEITEHLQKVVAETGSVDISFNLIGYPVVQNIPLTEMSVDAFANPVNTAMRSQFLTATSAAKLMMKQGSGVLLSLTATPGGIGYPFTGGFAPACTAMETLSKNLASELGIYGIRAVNIRSGGSPDSKVFADAMASMPEEMALVLGKMKQDTMLKQLPMMADIANTAVFLASAMAAKITGVTIDVTSGTTAALNYKVERTDIPAKASTIVR